MSIQKQEALGPRVLGQELYDKLQAEKAVTVRGGNEQLGHRITGGKPVEGTPAATTAAKAAAEGPVWDADIGSQSINTLTQTLADEPERFESLRDNELIRPGGPRKGALRALLSHAGEHELDADDITAALG